MGSAYDVPIALGSGVGTADVGWRGMEQVETASSMTTVSGTPNRRGITRRAALQDERISVVGGRRPHYTLERRAFSSSRNSASSPCQVWRVISQR